MFKVLIVVILFLIIAFEAFAGCPIGQPMADGVCGYNGSLDLQVPTVPGSWYVIPGASDRNNQPLCKDGYGMLLDITKNPPEEEGCIPLNGNYNGHAGTIDPNKPPNIMVTPYPQDPMAQP